MPEDRDPANDNAATGAATGKPCPICGRPAVVRDKPFCSPRCADVDLNRWLGGVYSVPAEASASAGHETSED